MICVDLHGGKKTTSAVVRRRQRKARGATSLFGESASAWSVEKSKGGKGRVHLERDVHCRVVLTFRSSTGSK